MVLAHITRSADPQCGLRPSLGLMLQKQTMVDMTLICSSHSIRVHKAVLAANSFYLEKIITQFKDDIIIVMRDMSFQAMRGLVEFMYCGRTRIDESFINEMLSAGKYLQVLGISNIKKMEGQIQSASEDIEGTKFQLSSEGGPSIKRPIIFIRLNEKKDVNAGKVPIVMEINSNKILKTQNYRKDTKCDIKSEDHKPNSEELTQGNDVEILRIPFELKNNKPVRNQIKEFIGETMPELILKPRRGRPTVKPLMERSLIKNNGLFQITLDNSDETLRCEEALSKRTIAKMEKQMYGRDIQQQFVIEQAVSSIVDSESTNFELNNQNILKSASPEALKTDEVSNNDFTDMNLLIDNDYYSNEIPQVSQVLSISDIEALNVDGNVQYQNLDELSDVNNINYNDMNFTIVTQEGNGTIEYSYLDEGTTVEGDSIIYNANELIDYDPNMLFANQLTYNFENGYYEQNNATQDLSNLQILQQQFDNISDDGNNTNFIAFGNEVTFENREQTLATNEIVSTNTNVIYNNNSTNQGYSGFSNNYSGIYNEIACTNNDMPMILNEIGNNTTKNNVVVKDAISYQRDSDIFEVVKNNEYIDMMISDEFVNMPNETMNSETDLLNALEDNSDSELENSNSNDQNESWFHKYNSFPEITPDSSEFVNNDMVTSTNEKTGNDDMYKHFNNEPENNNILIQENPEFSQYYDYDETMRLFDGNIDLDPSDHNTEMINSNIIGNEVILKNINEYSCRNSSFEDTSYDQENNGDYSPISEISFRQHMNENAQNHMNNNEAITRDTDDQFENYFNYTDNENSLGLFGAENLSVKSESSNEEIIETNEYNHRTYTKENVGSSYDQNEVEFSENSDIPAALGLLPVRTALEQIQNIHEFKPRQTRASIQAILERGSKRNSSPTENNVKKRKL